MKTKALLALLLLFCIFLPVLAQTKPTTPTQSQKTSDDQDDVVRINTNLVQVDAVVTKDGKPVPNLTAEDFEIFEDGRRQTIISFAYISNVPNSTQPVNATREKDANVVPFTPVKRDDPHRTIAFVVDDLALSAESVAQVRRQLRKFVAEQLQPNDLVAVIRTGGELGALQQFTNDRRAFSGPEIPIVAGDQHDLTRVLANGVVRLTPDLEPGSYYLQVAITEQGTKSKAEPVVQWVDFEIVK